MSFGFGIGDLLSIANTIERIVVEIKAYRSAPSNFQRLAVELELLTTTCTQILHIEPTQADDAVRMENIRKSMCLCLGPLKAFAEKMRCLEDSLGVSKKLSENQGGFNEDTDRDGDGRQGHQNTVRRRYRSVKDRIHWSMIESKEIDELRAVVAGQLVAVDTLLNVRTWTCLTEANNQSKEISERLQRLINDTRAASDESRQFYLSAKAVAISQWDEIQRWQTLSEEERIELKKAIVIVGESNDETKSWTKMLINTVSLWGEKLQDQVDNLTRVNHTFSAYLRTLITSCASITEMIERNFRTLLNVYEVLVRIERMILAKAIEMPHLRFDDPFGETLALPYQMCNTWQHFNWLLAAMFQDKPGRQLVQRGSFMIMTAKANKIIDAKQWEHAVRSGDHLSMSMVLRRRSMNVQRCPRCSTIWEDDSQTQQKGRTCNACEFWFSTLDEEPDSAGRIVTMGGERIELYEVPDAPRNDHSSSGPPVLPERHVTSSLVTPVSIGIEDETDGDTGLFRRIHFVISGNVATVIDVSELNGVENTDVNFSLSGWHDKCSDGVESSPDGGEQPIVSTTPPLISKESKPKKAKKAKKVEEAKKVKEVKKEKSFSSQAISDDRPIPLIYRSPIASPYYHASSNNVYPGRSPTPPPYYHASPTYVHPRRSLPFSPYYYATSTSDDHRRSPTPLPYHCAPLTRNYPRPRTQHSTDQTDGFRLSRLTYYAEYGSQRSIRRSTGQVSHASRFLSRDDKPIDADEVDTIEYYNDSFMDMQIESSRRLNARRTTWKPAERPHTAVRSPQPRPATEADRKLAQIPVGYSLKSWDPTESPIILLGTVFDAKSLGKWIYDWTSYHYPPHSPIREVAGELWLLLIKVAGKMNLAENRFNRIYTTEKREMIEDFLDSGYIIWDRLKKLLKVCEDNMWKAYKRDNSKRRSSNDGQPQSPENHTNSENGENNEASHHKDKRASKGGSKVKGSTDVHAGDQQAADSGSGHGNAESEPLMVQPEERNRSAQFYAADNDLEDKKREKQKSRDSKGVERIQLGVNSGIAFVEALFGRDKALERTEKLMVNMDLWILRFDANCGEILLPKSVTQTVRRGRKSSTEIRSYNRSRSTTPKARNVDIYSVASWNKTRTRSTTPKGRPIHADSRAATRYSNVSEVAGGFSTMNAEQSASTFDSEKQQSDDAKPLEERESLTPATKKKKKRKSKEPVTKDSNSQPEIFEAIKDSEDSRELPLH